MGKKFRLIASVILIVVVAYGGVRWYSRSMLENRVLRQVIARLEAESRIAEVLVSKVEYDESKQKTLTTIKFLEFDAGGKALSPRYFTFAGNIIQFQSLVIRFDDIHIKQADRLRGKSAHLFWKIFMLDGRHTQEFEITKVSEVPEGYKIDGDSAGFQEKLWKEFWKYALDPNAAKRHGIKNAQIEAPGTMFIPGMLYTIKIEHDGGIRIDAVALPTILKGETIP